MTTTTETAPVETAATTEAPEKKTRKRTTKKAAPKASTTTKKSTKKAPAKKAEKGAKSADGLPKLTKNQKKIIVCLSKHKELTYAGIAEKAGVFINNLTQDISAESKRGTQYPNSLEARGLIKYEQYENNNGTSSPYFFSLTTKGLAIVDEVKAELAASEKAKASKPAKTKEAKTEKSSTKPTKKATTAKAPKTSSKASKGKGGSKPASRKKASQKPAAEPTTETSAVEETAAA